MTEYPQVCVNGQDWLSEDEHNREIKTITEAHMRRELELIRKMEDLIKASQSILLQQKAEMGPDSLTVSVTVDLFCWQMGMSRDIQMPYEIGRRVSADVHSYVKAAEARKEARRSARLAMEREA